MKLDRALMFRKSSLVERQLESQRYGEIFKSHCSKICKYITKVYPYFNRERVVEYYTKSLLCYFRIKRKFHLKFAKERKEKKWIYVRKIFVSRRFEVQQWKKKVWSKTNVELDLKNLDYSSVMVWRAVEASGVGFLVYVFIEGGSLQVNVAVGT